MDTRIGNSPHWLMVVFLCVIFSLIRVEGQKYQNYTKMSCGASPDALITSVVKVSEAVCLEECVRRTSCKALDYSLTFKVCNLFTRDDVQLVNGRCAFIKRLDIIIHNSCSTCEDGKVCDLKTNECVLSECQQPTVTQGTVFGNKNSIGSKKRYMCRNRFGEFLMPSFECLTNGSWSRQPIVCEDPINVAAGKTVTMSSQFDHVSPSVLLVNGVTDGIWPCACTKETPFPWMVVDLAEHHVIFAFLIYNRRDCCPERLHNLTIYVCKTMDSLKVCIEHPYVLDPVLQTSIVTQPCYGRYIKLHTIDANPVFITICELQVYGHPF